MADPKGFLTAPRHDCARRPARERVRERFLITRMLRDYLQLFAEVRA